MTRALLALIAPIALLASAAAGAAQFRTFAGNEVHYNAVRADFIEPEVAVQHGITRSASRGLVNIAVLRKPDGEGIGTPITAEIVLTVENLAGQSQAVRLKEVREATAIYYIGEFRITGTDTYRFSAEVKPEGAERWYNLRWAQQLVNDGR